MGTGAGDGDAGVNLAGVDRADVALKRAGADLGGSTLEAAAADGNEGGATAAVLEHDDFKDFDLFMRKPGSNNRRRKCRHRENLFAFCLAVVIGTAVGHEKEFARFSGNRHQRGANTRISTA